MDVIIGYNGWYGLEVHWRISLLSSTYSAFCADVTAFMVIVMVFNLNLYPTFGSFVSGKSTTSMVASLIKVK